MKALAKFLAGVAIVVVALLAYLILGSGLTVTMEMEIAPASSYAEEYVRMIGSEEGIESYSIVHIVAQAKNKGMLPAEWVELNFSTLEGDRLAYDAQIGPSDIPAFGSETFSVSILTQNQRRAQRLAFLLFDGARKCSRIAMRAYPARRARTMATKGVALCGRTRRKPATRSPWKGVRAPW